jgi:hypothetical protein
MSWLLFMDESGHDHRTTPYEVRGGFAIRDSEIWPFMQEWRRLERDCFGGNLSGYGKELKGCKLLDKDRFKWESQSHPLPDESRRRLCRSFLSKGQERKKPTRDEFTAYGQASLEMARGIFQILRDRRAVLFASAIPREVEKPDTFEAQEFLRKDHVFLLERYYYHLQQCREYGLIVMDETDKAEDRTFVRKLEAYFEKTTTGRLRTKWIVPTPFFVSSDMAAPIQAADVCIYCINWGFRKPSIGMDGQVREEIADEFGPWLDQLQFEGMCEREDGQSVSSFGVVYVPDPYTSRVQ